MMNERIQLFKGDCLEKFKNIPDKSINLVLIDPPYNISKAEWDKWEKIDEYIDFMGKVFKECERVLKDNGSFYFFHNDFLQVVELQNWINRNTQFIFKSFLIWNKRYNGSPRKYYFDNVIAGNMNRNHRQLSEYCLYYTFQDETGLKKVKTDMNNFKNLRQYSKNIQEFIGLKLKEINKILGHRRAEHFFYHSSTQWDLCIPEIYQQLIDTFKINEYKNFREYKDLKQEYEELRQEYEKQRYTFNLKEVQKNISCVWEVESTNSGRMHSCEKPINILEKIIKTSSNENDTVLDCFMGSGSTGVACINTNRKFIGIEKDEKYFEIACNRIKEVKK